MSDEEYQAQINAEAEAAQYYAAQQAEDDKSKPTGWVAWHPFHRGFIRDSACEVFANIQGAEDLVRRESSNKYLQAARWRIRPVKLLFLDEVEK